MSSDCWATLAVRLADLTAENVATARISVPSAVARSATVVQADALTAPSRQRARRRGKRRV